MDWTFLADLGKGLISGAVVGLVGYVKSMPDGESFDWIKAGPTVIIGGVVGIVSYWAGVDMSTAYGVVAAFGAVAFINSVWTYFFKKARNGGSKVSVKIKGKKRRK